MVERSGVAPAIEATVLGDDVAVEAVRRLCVDAARHDVRGVCVPLRHVPTAAEALAGSRLRLVTVAGFPRGDDPTEEKVAAVARAAETGAGEVDIVIDHRRLVAGDAAGTAEDLRAVVEAAHHRGLELKAIVETGALQADDGALERACELAVEAGADWVKTCTGFGPRGASVEDVERMRAAVDGRARVKAAGGIRTWSQAVALLEAGADALGCSSFVAVLEGD